MTLLNRNFARPAGTCLHRHQWGLSLIELMIAITLGLLILAGMVLVFANTSAARNEVERTTRQIENGRYAIELLREDIQLAGFFGETDMHKVDVPLAVPDPCSRTLAEWTGAMKLHVQGVDNFVATAPAPDDLSCLPGIKPGTDVVIIRRAKTCIAGAAGCDAVTNGKPYLQVPLCSLESATHTLDLKTGTNFNVHQLMGADPKTCLPAVLAPLRPYVVYFYFVGTDNTLTRATFNPDLAAASAITDIIKLVDGIENLQLDYGVDNDGDGSADVYLTGSPTTLWTADAWANVMTVQINLLAQNTELSPGYKDIKTYNLGPSAGEVGPFNDGRRRNVYSTMVRMQNPSGLRDTP